MAKNSKSKPFEMRSEMVKKAAESRVAVSFVARFGGLLALYVSGATLAHPHRMRSPI